MVCCSNDVINSWLSDRYFSFFSIACSTDISWFTLALGDLLVKLIVALIMLVPFRMFISRINDFADLKFKNLATNLILFYLL